MGDKRIFSIEFTIYEYHISTAVIEIDQAVIDAVDDEWRSMFYDLHTPEQIAAHVGSNLIIDRVRLSSLDGWADQPNSNAKVLVWPDLDSYDLVVTEIKQ